MESCWLWFWRTSCIKVQHWVSVIVFDNLVEAHRQCFASSMALSQGNFTTHFRGTYIHILGIADPTNRILSCTPIIDSWTCLGRLSS